MLLLCKMKIILPVPKFVYVKARVIHTRTIYLIGSSKHLTGFYKIRVFTKRNFKANFDSDLFFMDFKQNQYIDRGDNIKIAKNSMNLQGVKTL